jgi:hypothetical protein
MEFLHGKLSIKLNLSMAEMISQASFSSAADQLQQKYTVTASL